MPEKRRAAIGSRLQRLGVLVALALSASCGGERAGGEPAQDPQPPRIVEQGTRIVDADGASLLHITDLPGSIPVDAQTAFGAARRFTAVSMAPDGQWLALTSSGAAHGAGWLLRVGAASPRPAAFQYGGDVRPGPWRGDARYAVFIRQGPSEDRLLTVVDRQREAATVSEAALPVRIPGHDALAAGERIYRQERWQQAWLHFRVADRSWGFKPETGKVRAAP